ncbi:ABC-F family ATP-binding cassette domain-containing protein [uncultured Corynebacterium sp.]|uniref:ABC-F family ATP-binding cassette domain-containing protein n=1 Tax=uncultured Corynebacterium sp. TaxID=159447 RepID=UPI002606185C|nr:ABC-F family ATP-binding cassette domain-containing protein [uncultured Corynebacterium sp.]
MATIEFRGVGAAYGPRTLFAGLDLVLAPGDVAGLSGPNGAGKSTLLAAAAGEPAAEMDGEIVLSPPDATVGLLEQEVERRDETVAEFVARRTGVAGALAEMDACAEAMADCAGSADDAAADAYSAALERWLALGGADLDERLPKVAADLGLDDAVLGLPMTALSGGQAARANLAVILLAGHDVLLLDEPTNDLDHDGLARLEEFIAAERRPMFIVSHDREFLSRTITRMVELDAAQRQIIVFDGGYDAFLAERELRRRRAREEYEEYEGAVGKLRDRLQTQKTWLDKGTRNAMRAHGGKNPEKDKHIRHRAGQRSEKQAGKIAQTERAIERMDVVEEPRKEWELRMSIAAAPRSGTVVATLRGAVAEYPGFTFGPVSLQVNQGERVLIEGPNGAGKSTLLALLTGERAPDAGDAAVGSGVLLGRVDQARALFDGPDRLLDRFAAHLPDWSGADCRTLLAKFGLGGDHVTRGCAGLSPGERTRAALALLQARGVNTLVLDEPTNHLDLPAIEQLEQALESFNGTVLLITHDRRMRDAFRATRALTVDAGRVVRDGHPDG